MQKPAATLSAQAAAVAPDRDDMTVVKRPVKDRGRERSEPFRPIGWPAKVGHSTRFRSAGCDVCQHGITASIASSIEAQPLERHAADASTYLWDPDSSRGGGGHVGNEPARMEIGGAVIVKCWPDSGVKWLCCTKQLKARCALSPDRLIPRFQ